MLRTIRRWFTDAEVKALAYDCEKMMDKVMANGHAVEGLQLRVERMINRTNMRLTRAGVPRDEERDQEIMDELRRYRGNGDQGEPPRFD